MEEPSVLDYLKSKLLFWRHSNIEIPASPENEPAAGSDMETAFETGEDMERPGEFGFKGLLSAIWTMLPLIVVLFGLVAQASLEPPDRSPVLAVILYVLAAILFVFNIVLEKWVLPAGQEEIEGVMASTFRRVPGIITLILLPFSFFFFYGNRFTQGNLVLWGLLIAFFTLTFWENPRASWLNIKNRITPLFKNPVIHLKITPWVLLILACTVLVIFFRFYNLSGVPGEAFSDHAEKILDVSDVLNGQTSIFFPRNTGREGFQMYLSAVIALLSGGSLGFMTLKIGTALAGLATLPFIYLIGKQIGGRWVGLFSFLLAGIAYWPNVISRIGLRFPLYPLFWAPALYFLIRAFQNHRRNDLLMAGFMIGLGLHGYSPFRIVPFVVLIAFAIYFFLTRYEEDKANLGFNFLILAAAALVIFLPLLKYMTEDPEAFGLRAFTRLGTVERPLPGPVLAIFGSNLGKALIMFFYDNGSIWVHSVVGRPALDVVGAVFLMLGSLALLVRFIQKKSWVDLFMLISIPLLMLPSILSLAFPEENPSLNRTAGAVIPVFVVAAYGMVSFLQSLMDKIRGRRGQIFAGIVAVILIGMSINQNFDLVFNQFNRQFISGAWNTSEIGAVVKDFIAFGGDVETAYVIPYPYWVDTRLVGVNAGLPTTDFALPPENIDETRLDGRMKLFIINPQDQQDLDKVKNLYPQGVLSTHKARVAGKDFLTYLVPPQKADGN
jgi:hypothetical protein